MASRTVVEAVRARLAEHWSACVVLPGSITAQLPKDGKPFLLVQFPVASTERMTVNERRYRESGAFRIVIATRRSEGADQPLGWAEDLSRLFRDRRFGGIRTQVPGTVHHDDDSAEGVYLRTSFAVPFTHDFKDEG